MLLLYIISQKYLFRLGLKWAQIIVGRSGLLFSNGELHKKHRRIISPAFKMSNLKSGCFYSSVFLHFILSLLLFSEHIPIIQNSVERLVSLWRSQISELKNDDSFAELCVMNDIYRMVCFSLIFYKFTIK